MPEQAVSRVLFPPRGAKDNDHSSSPGVTTGIKRPTRELGRTTLCAPLFSLAPGGVYLAPAVTGRTGELLPHRFTLTPAAAEAVCFLWHFPSRCQDWGLPSTLSYGARTFLPLAF
jgi:hypothetical protein